MTRRTLLFAAAPLLMGQARLSPLDEASYGKLLAGHKGSVVLVDFWATWCAPCRKEMPELVALESKLRSKGVKLVTVSCDEPEQEAAASAFLQQHKVPGPAYIKRARDDDRFIGSVAPDWSGALPALFLYDRQGRRARSFIGEADMAVVEAAIRQLL